ncbi:MAG: DUF4139 domain-containing protein [Epsilonproteobacteria bacterium]|nr:DUF4139 domain-containing protein [Campylobacterota bacterium]
MSAKNWLIWLLAAGVASASVLEIYLDGARYTYRPRDGFIGFTGEIEAFCAQRPAALVETDQCPTGVPLCGFYRKIEKRAHQVQTARIRADLLRQTTANTRQNKPDAKALIRFCEVTGAQSARWEREAKAGQARLKRLRGRFAKRARSSYPVALAEPCLEDVTLIFPAGVIGARVGYTVDISAKKEDRARITQLLWLTNRSGVDIEADEVRVTAEPVARRLVPYRFTPWVIREDDIFKRMAKSRRADVAPRALSVAMPSKLTVEAPRRYRIDHMRLPSTATPLRAVLRRWDQKADYWEVTYSYRDRRVFKTLAFSPKYPIDADNDWRVVDGGRLVAKKVQGAYREGRYTLFLGVDEDVNLQRERLHLKAKESFFGSSVHRRDGYRLILVNRADTTKRVRLIDRIPVATRADVTVKLLSVTAKGAKLSYKLKKEGRLEMDVTLAPRANATVDVLFEVIHDKEKPVAY